MPSETEIHTFIIRTFRSVWALELVQILADDPQKHFSRSELIETLRASDSVVQQGARSLMAAGLVVIDDEWIRLHDLDERSRELLNGSIELYKVSPDKVRRLIVAQSMPGATAFSDAFKLWKD